MRRDPIDFGSPLGISKKEWVKVLAVNLGLLLTIYTIAVILTLCGNDYFALNFYNDNLQNIETTLRNIGIYALVQIAFETVEATIITAFIARWKIKFWVPVAIFASFTSINLICWGVWGYVPPWTQFVNTCLMFIGFTFAFCHSSKRELLYGFIRLGIATVVSFVLNEGISIFRIQVSSLGYTNISNSVFFALSFEYDIALVLSLILLTLVLPFKQKGDIAQCPTIRTAGGCSPTTTSSLPKNLKIAKNNLSPKFKKRLRLLMLRTRTDRGEQSLFGCHSSSPNTFVNSFLV